VSLDLYNEDFKDIIFIDGIKIYSDSNGDRIVDIKRLSKKVEQILKEAEIIDAREDINSYKGEKREIKKCVADKGYYDANEMRGVMEMGIEPVVKKERMRKEDKYFRREDFIYDKERDIVICPGKRELTFNGIVKDKGKEYRRYRCSEPVCKSCSLNHRCIWGRKRESAKVYTMLNDIGYLEKYKTIMVSHSTLFA